MAKAKGKGKAADKAETKSAKDEPKYGVEDLAEAVGNQPASIRVALRELEVEKNFGNKYGWETKKEFDEIVAALKERASKRIGADKDEKPAKGKAGKGKKK